MSQEGAELQGYNNELVIYIEELRGERNELHRSILEEEEEKEKLQNDLRVLTEHLAKVDESLSKKKASRIEFDKTIGETEGGYTKILKSSQTLLNVVKLESQSLKEKSHPAPGAPSQRNTLQIAGCEAFCCNCTFPVLRKSSLNV